MSEEQDEGSYRLLLEKLPCCQNHYYLYRKNGTD